MNTPLKTPEVKAEKAAPATASYTSHPVENFRIGRFVFEKGLLNLSGDDVAAFEALHESLPPMEKNRIRKLDVAAAEAFVRDLLENAKPAATQAFDSSIGERAKPVVGTGKLEDSNADAGK